MLSLYSNQLTGTIPAELGSLTNLERLYLSYNQLTGTIPPELGSLTNLERLYLSYNQLTGTIPPALGSLTNLERLYLSYNQLTGTIPPALGSLTNLEWLNLSGNQLTGCIPQDLGGIPTERFFRAWPAVMRHARRSDHRHSDQCRRHVPDRSLDRSHQHRHLGHQLLTTCATLKSGPPISPTPTGPCWKTSGRPAPIPWSTP